ncbi:MAG: ADP-ribosylglycohydrolase family protein [Chloroflexota bacterium]
MPADTASRRARALTSLAGLSVGDAFGDQFFLNPATIEQRIQDRIVPPAPWPYTDDTEMTLSVMSVLWRHGRIDQDALALAFADHYDPSRGYGPAMHRIIARITNGEHWSEVAGSAFDGLGSYGNGAAMRSAPIGAYFADDLDAVIRQSTLAAQVTHAHPEGIAGGIAVAVAAALACNAREQSTQPPEPQDFLEQVQALVPPGEVQSRLRRARDLDDNTPVQTAVAVLGNGTGLSAQDTVPFALWCAARNLNNYVAALWETVSGLGDRDTTCAIAGSIVAAFMDRKGIPASWLVSRERLPEWTI